MSEQLRILADRLTGGPRLATLRLDRIPGAGQPPQAVAALRMLVHPGVTDHVSRALLQYGYWEGHETRLLIANIRPGDIVLDVGANIGYHALLSGALAGTGGRVIAFEPAADNFCLLNRNLRLNGLTNVDTLAAAVSDSAGAIVLRHHATSSGGHTIADLTSPVFTSTTLVPTLRLDDLPLERVDFIKIDIQGAELRALDGARATIARNRQRLRILLEFNVNIYVLAGERERAVAWLDELRAAFDIQFCDPTVGDFYPLDMSTTDFIDMAAGGERTMPDGRQWTRAVGYSDLWLTPRS